MSDQTPDEVPDQISELGPLDPSLAAWFSQGPVPPMPPQVWERIEAALAAEQPYAPAAAAALSHVVPISQAKATAKRGLVARTWPILGAAAAIVLIGVVVLPLVRGGGSQPVTDAGGSVASATPAVGGPESTPPLTGSSQAGGSSGSNGSGQDKSRHANAPVAVLSTGTDYSHDAMPQQVDVLLTTAGIERPVAVPAPDDTAVATPSPVGDYGFTTTPETLMDCLERLGVDAATLPALVVDRATYAGTDAGVVVMMKNDPAIAAAAPILDVIVVGPMCTDADVAAAQHFEVAPASSE